MVVLRELVPRPGTSHHEQEPDSAGPPPLGRGQQAALAAAALVAVVIGFQAWPWRLDDVPGDLGDPALIAAILQWVSSTLVTDPSSVFELPFFHPESDVLAFSEPLVPQALVFGLVGLLGGGWAVALSVTSVLFAWMNLITTFALTRYLTRSTAAAVVAATSFGFSAYVYSHWSHTQLLSVGFVPWAFLLLFRLLDRPRWRTAVALGAVQAALVLGSLYHGMVYAICVGLVLVARPVLARALPTRAQLAAVAGAGALTGAILLPFAVTYFRVQRRYDLVRDISTGYSMGWSDLFRPPASSVLRTVEVIHDHSEHALSPGLLAWLLAAVGVAVLVRAATRVPDPLGARGALRTGWLALLVLAGATALVLAASSNLRLGGTSAYDLLHAYLPGFSGMRVAARLAIVGVLAVSVLAGVGVTGLLARVPTRGRAVAAAALSGVLFLELLSTAPWATAPPETVRAENDVLAELPAGPVVELPVISPADPRNAWPFVEAPRMADAVADGHPRVNGYSGFAPPTYVEDVEVLNRFPEPEAMALLDELGVRYVVLHLGCEAGFPAYAPDQAETVASALGPSAAVGRTDQATVLDLRAVDSGASPAIGEPRGACG